MGGFASILATGFLLAQLSLAMPLAHAANEAAICPPTPKPFEQAELKAGMAAAQDRGMMWRIEKDGRISWLYGTIHMARREWVFPGAQTQWALRSADRLAVELDLSDPTVLAEMLASLKAGPDTPPVPPALAPRLAAQVRAACVGPDFTLLRPDEQATSLVFLAGRSAGLDLSYGIDMVLIGFAKVLGKTVTPLETVQQQVEFLRPKNAAESEARITEALEALEKNEITEGLAGLAQAWAAGQLEAMARIGEETDTPAQRAADVKGMTARNLVMADEIAAIHDGGQSVFAAVGALHMEGAQGLPALLAGRGFEVSRVRFADLRDVAKP